MLTAIILLIVPACTKAAEPAVVILPTATLAIQPTTATPLPATQLPTRVVSIPDYEKFPKIG